MVIKLTTKSDGDIISALLQECLPYLYGEVVKRTGHEFDCDADRGGEVMKVQWWKWLLVAFWFGGLCAIFVRMVGLNGR